MASQVLSFAARVPEWSNRVDWTNAELAELYRVEHALVQGRIAIETDRGITDEGDPWFVFCRADGEVVVHIARFGGYYHLYSPALPKPLIGPTFAALTKSFLSGVRTPVKADETLSIHPAALLSVLVAAIFYSIDFHSSSASAAEALADRIEQQSAGTQAGQHVELPAKETLFHTLVTSIKAFLDPGTAWDLQQFAFLAVVENAAMVAVVALSGLAESILNLQSGIVTPAVADNHYTQQSQADRSSDSLGSNDLKQQDNSQTAVNLLDQASVLTNAQDNPQSNVNTEQNQTSTLQRIDTVAVNVKDLTSSPDSASLPTTDHQTIADASQREGSILPTIVDGSSLAVGQHTNDATVATNSAAGSQDTVSLVGSDNSVSINLAQGSEKIDVSASAGADTIAVTGDGDLQISGIKSIDNPQIDVGANSTQAVTLVFTLAALPSFTIQLNGHDAVSLADVSANTASVHVTLDSEGSSANEVAIADTTVSSTAKLNITVIGVQALTLTESAQAFANSTFDTTGLSGTLTLGLNLDNVFQSVDLSQVSAANFVVGDSGNIALLQATSGSNIQLSSDLNMVDLTVAGATPANPGTLALDLQTSAANSAPVNIDLLDAYYTASLAVNSTDAGPGGINAIETLTDSSLATLTITGDSSLTVNSINGPSASDSQSVTIDAHALTGSLDIDVSGIADTTALGRLITIIGGSGNNILTNDTVSESTTFVAGAGDNIVNIGSGAIKDSIVNLTAVDTVNIGSATHNDVVVNEAATGTGQTTINEQSNLTAAAQVASGLTGSTAADQATLFSYQGNLYVFIDTGGNHTFTASSDAIIKLVGLAAAADLTSVFHSA